MRDENAFAAARKRLRADSLRAWRLRRRLGGDKALNEIAA
jgi:hypothetical protein